MLGQACHTAAALSLARSGHASVRSLARYARVSAEALARHQAGRDRGDGRQLPGVSEREVLRGAAACPVMRL